MTDDGQVTSDRSRTPSVHPVIDRLGRYSWRLIGIGIVGVAALLLLARLRIVVLPVIVAALLTAALGPPARFLRRRGVPSALAAWAVMLGFLGFLVGAGFVIVPPLAEQFAELGPTISRGVDDVERWLVEDAPVDISRQQLRDLRQQAGERLRDVFARSGGVVQGAVVVFEVVAGALLALVTTFFFLKDGEALQAWWLNRLPAARRDQAKRLGAGAWRGLTGYLRGAALLGVIEGTAMGVTLTAVGAGLALPVAVLTFLAAFVPFIGAIVAGTVAVLVALVTGGLVAALIVAAVAIAVQQLDNDILAPLVFGRTLHVHPLVILLSVGVGASLAGLAGVFLAVPVAAVVANVAAEANGDAAGEPAASHDPDQVATHSS